MRPLALHRLWLVFLACALVASLSFARIPLTHAQDTLIPAGAPVDLHAGTCAEVTTEPTADGGELTAATTDDVWDEDQLQAGMLVDDAAGVSGVDLNGDQTLQPTEVVVLNGQSAPVGKAEATFDEAIDTSQPIVVAVHAGSDTYETILACGALNTARDLGDGTKLTLLQPQGDAQVFGYAVFSADGTSLTTYVFQPNLDAAASATAVNPDSQVMQGYPVGIHEGTCTDWVTDPTAELGTFQKTNVAAEGEQDPGDLSGDVPAEAQSLGDVYKISEDDTEFSANDLFDDNQPYVVAVHESADTYTQLVACGQLLPILDGDQVVVILQPVGDSGQTGVLRLGQDAHEANGLLWSCQPLQPASPEATPDLPTAQPTPSPTTAPTETPTPQPSPSETLAPTATQEGTAVIVETVVTTETEVVPAPTATAAAGG